MSFARIAVRLRLLVRDERGIALPTALFATIASLGLAGAAVMSSVDVQQGSARDNGSKSAIATADAGANIAMQRLNQYADVLKGEGVCVNVGSAGKLEAGKAPTGEPGWCAAVKEPLEGEDGGATYRYQVSSLGGGACLGHDVCIVSTGTVDEVSRRVELGLDVSGLQSGGTSQEQIEQELLWQEQHGANQKVIEELKTRLTAAELAASESGGIAGLVGREEITLSGNNEIFVGVATDGNLVTSGNTTICGDIQVGIGKSWQYSGNKKQCAGHTLTQGNLSLPSVSSFIPSDIATHNSDGRLTMCSNGLPAECQKDTYNGTWSSTAPLNPKTHSITLSGNTTLTIGGGDYWLCSLTLSGNSEIVMAKGAHARFFFDTPEHCGASSQINISGNNRISATGYQPKKGQFDMPGFYLLGSTSYTSQVSISGNSSGNEFIIYAPDSYVTLSGNTARGIIVGRKVTISGNVKLEQDEGFEAPSWIEPGTAAEEEAETIRHEIETKEQEDEGLTEEEKRWLEEHPAQESNATYGAQSYVECTGGTPPTGSLPNADC